MNPSEREALKEQLSFLAGQGNDIGIELDSAERWVIGGLRDPALFFQHLHQLIPPDSILYFECADPVTEAIEFYEANRARDGVSGVARDMIFPVPQIFHVQIRSGLIEELVKLLGQHAQQSCFTHVKAYLKGRAEVLFTFHDAFEGSSQLLVSSRIPAEQVQSFCAGTGATYHREANEKRDPEVLRCLLEAMENPGKVRMFWPWWKRIMLFWKK